MGFFLILLPHPIYSIRGHKFGPIKNTIFTIFPLVFRSLSKYGTKSFVFYSELDWEKKDKTKSSYCWGKQTWTYDGKFKEKHITKKSMGNFFRFGTLAKILTLTYLILNIVANPEYLSTPCLFLFPFLWLTKQQSYSIKKTHFCFVFCFFFCTDFEQHLIKLS